MCAEAEKKRCSVKYVLKHITCDYELIQIRKVSIRVKPVKHVVTGEAEKVEKPELSMFWKCLIMKRRDATCVKHVLKECENARHVFIQKKKGVTSVEHVLRQRRRSVTSIKHVLNKSRRSVTIVKHVLNKSRRSVTSVKHVLEEWDKSVTLFEMC